MTTTVSFVLSFISAIYSSLEMEPGRPLKYLRTSLVPRPNNSVCHALAALAWRNCKGLTLVLEGLRARLSPDL